MAIVNVPVGGVMRRMPPVDRIVTRSTESGGPDTPWVCAEETTGARLNVTKNGVYNAADNGEYAYTVVDVRVPGAGAGTTCEYSTDGYGKVNNVGDADSVQSGPVLVMDNGNVLTDALGIPITDRPSFTAPTNAAMIVMDEDADRVKLVEVDGAGRVTERVLFQDIVVTEGPTKMTYADGESISLTGVKLAETVDGEFVTHSLVKSSVSLSSVSKSTTRADGTTALVRSMSCDGEVLLKVMRVGSDTCVMWELSRAGDGRRERRHTITASGGDVYVVSLLDETHGAHEFLLFSSSPFAYTHTTVTKVLPDAGGSQSSTTSDANQGQLTSIGGIPAYYARVRTGVGDGFRASNPSPSMAPLNTMDYKTYIAEVLHGTPSGYSQTVILQYTNTYTCVTSIEVIVNRR